MNLAATMTLNSAGFMNPLEGAKRGMESFRGVAEKLTGILGVIGVSFAAFKSAEGFTEGLKGIFDAGKELGAQSRTTGQSIRDLVILRKAYSEAGMDAGNLTANLAMMQAALGGVNEEGQPTKKIFDQLGLDMESLKSKSAAEQFEAIGQAINGLGDQSTKMAAIKAIFGRGGADMLNLFGKPDAIKEATQLAGGMGTIMQRNAEIFTKVANGFEALGAKVKGFFAGFAEQVAPVLLPLLDKLKSINLTGFGEALGGAVKTLYAAFNNGKLSELLSLSLQVGFAEGMDFLTRAWAGEINVMQEAVAEGMAILSDGDFWSSVGEMIKAAFSGVEAVLMTAFKRPIAALEAEVEQSVATLSQGKIDPMKSRAKTEFDGYQAQMEQLQKAIGKRPTMDKTYFDLQDQYAEVHKKSDAAAGVAFGKPDVGDRYNYMLQKGGPLDDIISSYKDTAGESFRKAGEHLKEVLAAKYIDPAALKKAWDDGFKQVFMTAPKELQERLSKLWTELQKSLPPGVKEPPAVKGGGLANVKDYSGSPARKGRFEEGDRLSKIGGFIGAGGPANDHARKTAENTGQLVKQFATFVQVIGARITPAGLPEWSAV